MSNARIALRLGVFSAFLWFSGKTVLRLLFFILSRLRRGLTYLLWAVLFFVGFALVCYAFVNTQRETAYRAIDPNTPICNSGESGGWSVLARYGNDEKLAIKEDGENIWNLKFQCALQHHVVPNKHPGDERTPLRYTLSLVEFKESGGVYELRDENGAAYSIEALRKKSEGSTSRRSEPITQLGALTNHLRLSTAERAAGNSHYVIAFVHGWRHDARIGDGNVSDLRVYAAHAARFLRDRCEAGELDHCKRKVTAVYLGWRGARVDEPKLIQYAVDLGHWLDVRLHCANDMPADKCAGPWTSSLRSFGEGLANGAAALTLFDRKPVSEDMAPHVRMALRSIEFALGDPGDTDRVTGLEKHNANRLIVFGHSLGGNMLATALHDDVIKQVRRHPGALQYFDPPIGNLTVLINPASEASKWTSIQRPVLEKMIFRDADGDREDVNEGLRFFAPHQKPVLISVTSAFAWPPGGVRAEDCVAALISGPNSQLSKAIRAADDKRNEGNGIEYDWATYELFPLFKMDFRPAAAFVRRSAIALAEGDNRHRSCDGQGAYDRPISEWFDHQYASLLRGLTFWRAHAETPRAKGVYEPSLGVWLRFRLADLLQDLPFQNTCLEDSRTIGHFDPPRFPVGHLASRLLSARMLGTTHEISTSQLGRPMGSPLDDSTIDYAEIPEHSTAACPISHEWLTRARETRMKTEPKGSGWDSEILTDQRLSDADAVQTGRGYLRANIIHGYKLSGINPITRANDPFWNIRADDNVLARHDGYMLSSFICAMNQLVMDRPTRWPPARQPTPAQPSTMVAE